GSAGGGAAEALELSLEGWVLAGATDLSCVSESGTGLTVTAMNRSSWPVRRSDVRVPRNRLLVITTMIANSHAARHTRGGSYCPTPLGVIGRVAYYPGAWVCVTCERATTEALGRRSRSRI